MKKFVIDIEPWDRKLLVVVGGYNLEVLQAIGLFGFGERLKKQVFDDPPQKSDEACQYSDNEGAMYLIWLEHWMNSEEDNELLIHETNHLVYDLARFIPLTDEYEAQAYTQVSVFRKIKKVLNMP